MKQASFKEIIERGAITCIEKRQIVTCNTCKGIGSYLQEQNINYHNNTSDEVRKECEKCNGGGRIVVVDKEVTFNESQRYVYPLDLYKGDDPWFRTRIDAKVKFDHRNARLESKYPRLQELTYENYDKELDRYESLDRIENAELYRKKKL